MRETVVPARAVQHGPRMSHFLRIESEADLEAALSRDLALIYKHSPRCGLSSIARLEMVYFAEGNPDVPIWIVDVIHQRSLSDDIEARFGIRHESPQVILLRQGRAVFDASHRGVSAAALERELRRASGAGASAVSDSRG